METKSESGVTSKKLIETGDNTKAVETADNKATRLTTVGEDNANKTVVETADNKAAAESQTVRVRALRTFNKDGNVNGEGEMVYPDQGAKSEFTTNRYRASQLRASGLVEYVSDSDAKEIHGDKEKEFQARDQARADEAKEFEKHKSTPLKAPSVRMKVSNEKDEKGE